MKTLNIDITNKTIASYALNGARTEVQIVFEGIPDTWQGKTIFATFVQDESNPTREVIDGTVQVPETILENGTDFYVGLYAVTYGSTSVTQPTNPILICVNSAESDGLNMQDLAKAILKINVLSQSLANVAFSGNYADLENTPTVDQVYDSASERAQSGKAVAAAIANIVDTMPEILETIEKISGELSADDNVTAQILSDLSKKVNESDLSAVALSGEYDDLSNRPVKNLNEIDEGKLDEITENGIYYFSMGGSIYVMIVGTYVGYQIDVIQQTLLPGCTQRIYTTDGESADNPYYWTAWENIFPGKSHTHSYKDLTNKPSIPIVDQVYNATSINAMSGVAMGGILSSYITSKEFEDATKYLVRMDVNTRSDFDNLPLPESGLSTIFIGTIKDSDAPYILEYMNYSNEAWRKQYCKSGGGRFEFRDWDGSEWGAWKKYLSESEIQSMLYPIPAKAFPEVEGAEGIYQPLPNKSYNLGVQTNISLSFPLSANDGDVIYITFESGETPTAIATDFTNVSDGLMDLIPEANTGYEIFAKYNGSIWIANYSDYTVSNYSADFGDGDLGTGEVIEEEPA